jgi:hypothetical protein
MTELFIVSVLVIALFYYLLSGNTGDDNDLNFT